MCDFFFRLRILVYDGHIGCTFYKSISYLLTYFLLNSYGIFTVIHSFRVKKSKILLNTNISFSILMVFLLFIHSFRVKKNLKFY